MNVLVGVVVYKRMKNIDLWLRAWHRCERYMDAKILIVHNYDGTQPNPEQTNYIKSRKPNLYLARPNYGQDIGAFQDIAQNIDYDVLLWATDDNIPVHNSFIRPFVEPFEADSNVGIVANYWVKGIFWKRLMGNRVPDHVRTSCFAINKDTAMQLRFPIRYMSKRTCYNFEWADKNNNMTEQVKKLDRKIVPVCGENLCWTDSNKYIWDIDHLGPKARDPRCRKNCWEQYEACFNGRNSNEVLSK